MLSDVKRLEAKILQTPLPYEIRQKCERYVARISAMEKAGGTNLKEIDILSKYIDWVTKIPFQSISSDNLDLQNIRTVLDNEHYALSGVKETIVEYMAAQKLRSMSAVSSVGAVSGADVVETTTKKPVQPPETNSQIKQASLEIEKQKQSAENIQISSTTRNYIQQDSGQSPTLCFIGVQGVGKTTMAKAIAKALGREFVRIPLGGFSSVTELRGLPKADTGAEPGKIVKALISAGTMNPVVLLDEIDKISETNFVRADVMAALLEILDPSQNQKFSDRYIDSPLDLSRIMFIATANNVGGLSAALLDRLELIRFSSYNDEEKVQIARNYLLPKVRKQMGLSEQQLQFSEEVWPLIVRPQGMDPGVRGLERNLRQIARKAARIIVEAQPDGSINNSHTVQITPQNFREFIPEKIEVYT